MLNVQNVLKKRNFFVIFKTIHIFKFKTIIMCLFFFQVTLYENKNNKHIMSNYSKSLKILMNYIRSLQVNQAQLNIINSKILFFFIFNILE